jgi:hypothetical protein
MKRLNWFIEVGKYRVRLLEKCDIYKSVDLLASTAEITLPGTIHNRAIRVENQIKRGDRIRILLGYGNTDATLSEEFAGWLRNINTDGGSIVLECEDDMFLLRSASVENTEMKGVSVKQIAEFCVKGVATGLKVDCNYGIVYDKFVIQDASAFDVMKKIQEETKANIYIRGGTLHIYPPYVERTGSVEYDFAKNVEKADLRYKNAEDRKVRLEIRATGTDGETRSVFVGTAGGETKVIKKEGIYDKAMLKALGESELKYYTFTGYEGSVTGWLKPVTLPGMAVKIIDDDYEYKNGSYYAVSVRTVFSRDGASRTVELGIKL